MGYRLLLLFTGLLLLAIAGCEKDFDVSSLEGDKKLVVNCQIDNLRPVKVFLTESVSPTGNNQVNPVTDAIVNLYVNDSFVQQLPFVYTDAAQTFGAYTTANLGVPGSKYSVKIEHAKYGAVSAQDTLLPVPVVTGYQLVKFGDSTNNYTGKFRFLLSDAAERQNFYRLNVYQSGQELTVNVSGDTVVSGYGIGSRPEMQTILQDTVRDLNTYLLFSDKDFNGQQKEMEFNVRCVDLNKVLSANFTVELMAISDSHYNYYKNLQSRAEFGSGSSVKPYGNIQGGYGIFMTQSIYTVTIPVK